MTVQTTAALAAVALSIAGLLSACVSAPPAPDDVALRTDLQRPTTPSLNARVLTDGGVLDWSFAASLDPALDRITRLESRYTLKIAETEEIRIGDTVSTSGLWGSAVRYAGVQYGTRIGLRENVLYSERLATSGIAVLPTTEEALFASLSERDNLLARQQLSLSGAPRINDDNALSLVARDSFGRTEAFSAPLVPPARLVKSGCSDFAIGIGKVREDYAFASNEYGPLFANTTIACAAPYGLTIEGHGEYLADQVAAFGVSVARHLGPIGTASLAIASSESHIGSGWLARIGLEHENRLFKVAARRHVQSRDFREVGNLWVEDPVVRRDLASVGLNLGERASVALAYAAQRTWQDERTDIVSLNQEMHVGLGSVVLTASHAFERDIGSSFFVQYNRPLGASANRARFDASDLDLVEVVVGKKRLFDGG